MEVKVEVQPRHSILLLNYNRPDLLRARLDEIDRFFAYRDDAELIVLDNGGNDESMALLIARGDQMSKAPHSPPGMLSRSWFRVEENMGFGPGMNYLGKHADGAILHFLSNDVQILGDFLTPVDAVLIARPRALVCHQAVDWPAGWNQFGGKIVNYPAGHYVACQAGTWEDLEGFDERFVPNDYEDVDLGMKCQQLGVPLLALRGLPLQHHAAGTIGYTPERYRNTVLQRKRFAEKWELPNIPEVP